MKTNLENDMSMTTWKYLSNHLLLILQWEQKFKDLSFVFVEKKFD